MADFLSSIFGSKPQVADYTPVDMSQEQLLALQGDISAWPDIQQLGNLYQSYMLNAYETAIPGFKNILAQGGKTTQDMLSTADQYLQGQIPEDVQQQVQRSSAFQSLESGTAGSDMSRALTARDFGTTSMGLVQQGAQLAGQAGNAAQRWAALSGAQLPEGMLVTPQQQAALDMQQHLIERNIQQQKYNVAAAPDPAAQAANQWLEQLGGTIVASYAGGGAGGMGGGGGKGGNYMTSYNPASYGVGDIGGGAGAAVPGAGGGSEPAYVDAGSMFASTPYQSQIAPNPFGTTTNINLGGMSTGQAYDPATLGSTTPIDLSQYFGQSGVTDFSGTSAVSGG